MAANPIIKTNNWLKDALLVSVGLTGLIGLATLLATDRIAQPKSFRSDVGQEHLASIGAVAQQVDQRIEAQLQALDLEFANRADTLTIARRLALSLAGTLPSVEEIRALEMIPPDKQVDWYLAHLLEDKRSSDFLAERFARALVGVEEGPFLIFRRRRFVNWFSEQLHLNRRYDHLATEILTGTGLWTDSPSVNFYTYNINPDENARKPDPIRLAARTSRAFLGMRIDCLQCHDDFLGTMNLGLLESPSAGTQRDFHALAAFFTQTTNTLSGVRDELDSAAYVYQLLDAETAETIKPEFPFHWELDSGVANQRKRLADWIVHPDNRQFSRATVNRVWAILFGKGLIDPIDDLPLIGPFPAALECLVDDFIAHDFNLQRLIRVIVATDAFQRSSLAEFEITSEHESNWAVFPLVRLRPEQVAGAVIQSTSLSTIDSTSHIITRLVQFGSLNDFVNRYGDSGENEFDDRGETVTQRLLMLNGEVVRERVSDGLTSPMRVANFSPSEATAVDVVYLSTLARHPSPAEQEHFANQLRGLQGNEKQQKILDIYWTLINSVEFVWSH